MPTRAQSNLMPSTVNLDALAPIDDAFAVDFARPLDAAGGGLPTFAAVERAKPASALMAVRIDPAAPARAGAIAALAGFAHVSVLPPLACGPVDADPSGLCPWYVICPAPPGPAFWSGGDAAAPMAEAEAIHLVLGPAAAGLAALAERGVTHRAVRPANLFRPSGGRGAVLGCAWASPPGMAQPAILEPPYLAMCPPPARGDGQIADDVYALGVTLLALVLGRWPMAALEPDAAIQRQLESGSFAALTAGIRLSPALAELLAAMLADDPLHRPSPALLTDPAAARSRRVAIRPNRRAAQSLQVETLTVSNARALAFALARHPGGGAKLLRLGVIDHWVRRSLGDAALASRLDDLSRPRDSGMGAGDAADSQALMRAIALMDPLAPLCWDGLALWPDGLGGLLASLTASDPSRGKLADLIGAEAMAGWAHCRADRTDPVTARTEARSWRAMVRDKGWSGGLTRLRYALCPLLPCRSPALGGRVVVTPAALPAALEAVADPPRAGLPLDREIVAFLAARCGGEVEAAISAAFDTLPQEDAALAQLRLLVPLQNRDIAHRLPRLAAWIAGGCAPLLAQWRNRARREAKRAQLDTLAAQGLLAPMLALLDASADRQADARAYRDAVADAERIDAEIARWAMTASARHAAAHRVGQEAAGAVALAALAACAVAAFAG